MTFSIASLIHTFGQGYQITMNVKNVNKVKMSKMSRIAIIRHKYLTQCRINVAPTLDEGFMPAGNLLWTDEHQLVYEILEPQRNPSPSSKVSPAGRVVIPQNGK